MEIKFKAKRKDNNEWVYGNYFHNFRKGESHNIIEFDSNNWHVVHQESVCMFLNLKDSEGNEVYSNDLLDFDEKEWGGEFLPEAITIEDIIGCWNLAGSLSDVSNWRKVVGNQYD